MRTIEANRRTLFLTSLLLIPAVLSANSVVAAEDAPSNDLLLNLFVEKGYVSQQEAQKVKEEAAKRQTEMDQYKAEAEQYKAELDQVKADMADLKAKGGIYQTNMPGSMPETKWLIGKGVTSVELFGDARVRYEARTAKDPSGRKIDLNRERYALRFGVKGEALQGVYYGMRLETSANPRSTWVSMGSSSSSSAYQGPYGKSSGTIEVGQVYLGWQPDSWIDITAGKMPNPL